MRSIFITSSGTGLGKTYLMTQLLQHDLVNHQKLLGIKPIISDWSDAPKDIEKSDTGLILKAQNIMSKPSNINDISPWRFTAPLTPAMAAAREGIQISLADLVLYCENQQSNATKQDKRLLIEGAGGLMSPIGDTYTAVEWIQALECGLLLVVGSYLGSLSHTLTTLAACHLQKLKVVGVILSETPQSTVSFSATAKSLEPFLSGLPLWQFPYTQAANQEVISSLYSALLNVE